MKQVTKDNIVNTETMIARGFIDRRRKTHTAVLEEQRQIIKDCNGSTTAAYLYNYYVSVVNIPVWDLTDDKKVAKQIGLTSRKVADTRRLLTKLGWIRFDVHTHKGVKYGLWYIGKEVVAFQMRQESNMEEFRKIGLVLEGEANA